MKDELTEAVERMYDRMEDDLIELMFLPTKIFDIEKLNEDFWHLKEQYKKAYVGFTVMMLRTIYSYK